MGGGVGGSSRETEKNRIFFCKKIQYLNLTFFSILGYISGESADKNLHQKCQTGIFFPCPNFGHPALSSEF